MSHWGDHPKTSLDDFPGREKSTTSASHLKIPTMNSSRRAAIFLGETGGGCVELKQNSSHGSAALFRSTNASRFAPARLRSAASGSALLGSQRHRLRLTDSRQRRVVSPESSPIDRAHYPESSTLRTPTTNASGDCHYWRSFGTWSHSRPGVHYFRGCIVCLSCSTFHWPTERFISFMFLS